jgi:hypothetical protein
MAGLQNYEILALEHVLCNIEFDNDQHPDYQKKGYDVWADHAYAEFPDKFESRDAALRFKAKRCAEPMIHEHESQFGNIETSKDVELQSMVNEEATKKVSYGIECKAKLANIKQIQANLKHDIQLKKSKEFLLQIAIKEKKQDEINSLTQEIGSLSQDAESKENQYNSALQDYRDYKSFSDGDIVNMRELIEEKMLEMTVEKVSTCKAHPQYKNMQEKKDEEKLNNEQARIIAEQEEADRKAAEEEAFNSAVDSALTKKLQELGLI